MPGPDTAARSKVLWMKTVSHSGATFRVRQVELVGHRDIGPAWLRLFVAFLSSFRHTSGRCLVSATDDSFLIPSSSLFINRPASSRYIYSALLTASLNTRQTKEQTNKIVNCEYLKMRRTANVAHLKSLSPEIAHRFWERSRQVWAEKPAARRSSSVSGWTITPWCPTVARLTVLT